MKNRLFKSGELVAIGASGGKGLYESLTAVAVESVFLKYCINSFAC